jgi:hypothetical protein
VNWIDEIWDRWLEMWKIERVPDAPPPRRPAPGVKRFLKVVADLDWKWHPAQYDRFPDRIGKFDDPETGIRTQYNLDDAEQYREFMRRVVASFSDDDLRQSLEFLRQPPWDWMTNMDKESWDLWTGDLLFEFWKERPDEVLPLLVAELEHPGIRLSIMNSFQTPVVIPYLMPWAERAGEFADDEVSLLIDGFSDYNYGPEFLTHEHVELARAALAKIRTAIPTDKKELHQELDTAVEKLASS